MSDSAPAIELEDVRKSFGQRRVLDGVSLSVGAAETVALIGPSGCGKTTALKLVNRLLDADAGTVRVLGRDVRGEDPVALRRRLGYVIQEGGLFPHWTVRQNVETVAKLVGWDPERRRRRAEELLEMVNLAPAEFGPRRPRQLSGGQRQRVAVGRAIVRHPQVFLFDEPLSNLDAKLRVQMRVELKRLHERLETTAIYVTHDQVEAMTLGSRVVVMRDGWVQQVGDPMEIYTRPQNRFVAGFIGHPPMNLLPGAIRSDPAPSVSFGEGVGFRITKAARDRMGDIREGGRFVLGFRPEHARLRKDGADRERSVRLDLIEPMGSEVWLEVVWGDRGLRVKVPADFDGTVGQEFELEIDESRLHFFDPGGGGRIA